MARISWGRCWLRWSGMFPKDMKFKQRSRAWERNLGSVFSADRTASKKTLKLWIKPVVQVGRRGWMLEGQAETRAIRIQRAKSLDFVANITYTSTQLCTQLNLSQQPLEIKYRASTTCRKSTCSYHYYCKISDGGKNRSLSVQLTFDSAIPSLSLLLYMLFVSFWWRKERILPF